MEEKKIELVKMCVADLKHGFGNPRKISKKKSEELWLSMETFGDFGIFLIDEDNNLIAGNQRATLLQQNKPETIVDCKRLIGYTNAELRAINIKDNTHAGEWDLDLLADWTADLTIDLGIDAADDKPEDRQISEMELIHYEKYDYVLIACRNEIDYNDLIRKLGIEDKKVLIAKKRKINARAIWYHQMKAELVPKNEEDSERGKGEEENG